LATPGAALRYQHAAHGRDAEIAVKHLQSSGLVTPPMEPWVERIRAIGNEANHEIPRVSEADARTVAKFTQQLLVMTYEYPLELGQTSPLPGAAEDEETESSPS
jgi:hypothetical protein